jgi:hypothetical protein
VGFWVDAEGVLGVFGSWGARGERGMGERKGGL